MKKNGIYDVLTTCYGVFMPLHPELFKSFSESEKNFYKALEQERKQQKIVLQQRLGKNYMQLLVGYLFVDINLPIVRAVCNDLDFQLCYNVAMGIRPNKNGSV